MEILFSDYTKTIINADGNPSWSSQMGRGRRGKLDRLLHPTNPPHTEKNFAKDLHAMKLHFRDTLWGRGIKGSEKDHLMKGGLKDHILGVVAII